MELMLQRMSALLDQKLEAALDQRLRPLETALNQKDRPDTDGGGAAFTLGTAKTEKMDAMGGGMKIAGASGATTSKLGGFGEMGSDKRAVLTSKAGMPRENTDSGETDEILSSLLGAGATTQSQKLKKAATSKAREVFPEGRYFNDAPIGESNLVPTEDFWADLREHYQEATVEHDEAVNPYVRPLKERQGIDLPHVWHMKSMVGDTGDAVSEARKAKKPQTAEEIEALHAGCSYLADLLIVWKETIISELIEAFTNAVGRSPTEEDSIYEVPEAMRVAERWMPLFNVAAHTQNLFSKRLEVVASSILETIDDATPEEKAFGRLLRSRGKVKRGLFTGSSMQAQREFHLLALQANMKSAAQRAGGGQDDSRGGRGARGDDDRLKRENANLRRQLEQLKNPSSSNGDGKAAKKAASPGGA